MTTVLQTVTLSLDIDVTDTSRRTDASMSFGFLTSGNYDKKDRLLNAGATYTLTEIPAQVFMLLTNGAAIDVTVNWGGSTPASRTFLVNKMLFLSDMTDIVSIVVVNNAASVNGNPPLAEFLRMYSF